MKKGIYILLCTIILTLTSCGGIQTISSGKADIASISFVANKSANISVSIDQSNYQIKTVKEKAYRKDRNFKKTDSNTVSLTPGQHKIVVIDIDGNKIYEHIVFLSANEHKIIRL